MLLAFMQPKINQDCLLLHAVNPVLLNMVFGYSTRGWALWADPEVGALWCKASGQSSGSKGRSCPFWGAVWVSLGSHGTWLPAVHLAASLACRRSDGSEIAVFISLRFPSESTSHKHKVLVKFKVQGKRECPENMGKMVEEKLERGKKKAKPHWF